jgi:prevent-host-death family protein
MDPISSAEAKKKLDLLIDSVNSEGEPCIIRSKKGSTAVLISAEEFEWIQQTMALISNFVNDEEFKQLLESADFGEAFDEGPEPLKTDFIQVYQFKVALKGIQPPIWRRIQVPGNYNFWDLHVAIQDAMGWDDSHFHEFDIHSPNSGHSERIGIPEDEDLGYDDDMIAGWKAYISNYFSLENPKAVYIYDFGDDWEHTVTLEKILKREKGKQYPVCLKGKRACPPEDCGGVWGYKDILETISDPDREERDELMEWLGEDFDLETFDPASIEFDDPREHWDFVFGEGEDDSQPN